MFPSPCPAVGAGSGGSVVPGKAEVFLAWLWGFSGVFISILSMPPKHRFLSKLSLLVILGNV